MSDGLDALVGVIPTVLVAGVATKMTQAMFSQSAVRPRSSRRVPYRRIPTRRGRIPTRRGRASFGDFSNIGYFGETLKGGRRNASI